MIDVIWRGEDGWVRPERPSTLMTAGRNRSSIAPAEDRSAPPTPKAATSETMLAGADAEPLKEEDKAPELPPRKKSGWGLGFGSLGGGKGLGLSKGDTPPQSPSSESQSRLGDVPVVEEQFKDEAVPGPVVPKADEPKVEVEDVAETRESQEDEGKNQRSSTDENEPVDSNEPAETGPDTLAVPKTDAAAGDSDAEEGGNDFSTPKSSSSVLVGDGEVASAAEVPKDEPTDKDDEKVNGDIAVEPETQAVDISSPRPSMDITASGRPSVDGSTAPPTPARSAARRAVPPPPGTSAAPPLPERNRTRPVSTATLGVENVSAVNSPTLPVTPDMGSNGPGNPITPEPPVSSSQATTPQAGPPKLPNRASMVPGTTALSKSGKRYVEGDSWEAKTWREVVRLKEDMWKARVGLVEGED